MVNSNLYNNLFNIRKNKLKYGGAKSLINLLIEKKNFLFKVFGLLILQLFITYIIAFNINTLTILNKGSTILFAILSIAIILIIGLVPMPIYFKLILFTLFSIIMGLLLSSIKYIVPKDIIQTALIGTISIFILMILLSLLLYGMGIELGEKVGVILFIILFISIISIIVFRLMNKYEQYKKYIAIFLLVIFGIYIIYDTHRILSDSKYYNSDYVTAAIDYYLDVINIFINLINVQQN